MRIFAMRAGDTVPHPSLPAATPRRGERHHRCQINRLRPRRGRSVNTGPGCKRCAATAIVSTRNRYSGTPGNRKRFFSTGCAKRESGFRTLKWQIRTQKPNSFEAIRPSGTASRRRAWKAVDPLAAPAVADRGLFARSLLLQSSCRCSSCLASVYLSLHGRHRHMGDGAPVERGDALHRPRSSTRWRPIRRTTISPS